MDMKAKQIADQYAHGTMPLDVVAKMYSLRDAEVAALAKQAAITVSDVRGLERTGRFKVADELYGLCNDAARNELLNDAHHGVRSAAAISAARL